MDPWIAAVFLATTSCRGVAPFARLVAFAFSSGLVSEGAFPRAAGTSAMGTEDLTAPLALLPFFVITDTGIGGLFAGVGPSPNPAVSIRERSSGDLTGILGTGLGL